MRKKMTRRKFLEGATLTAGAALLAACTPATATPTTAPTAPQATAVVPTATTFIPTATTAATAAAATPTTAPVPTQGPKFSESPMLKALVDKGNLPSVEKRLPDDPLVIPEISEVGQYGGILRLYAPSVDSFDDLHWIREANWVRLASDTYWDTKGQNGVVMHRAESITPSTDMTDFVVKIRKGMKWSDGVPVTADDILFQANDVWLDQDLSGGWYNQYGDNRPTVTKVDDFTVDIKFPKPNTGFLSDLAGAASNQGLVVGESPSHYLQQFHIKYNPDADKNAKAAGFDNWIAMYNNKSDCGDEQTNLDLPTINDWVLKSKSTTEAVYARNPYYWAVDSAGNQLPYIDGWVVSAVADVEVAKLKLIAGEIDVAGVFLIQLNEYPLLKQGETDGKYTIILNKGNATAKPEFSPNMNHKDPVLADLFQKPDFHKALSYGMNRDEINQIVFVGLAKPMQNVYTQFDYVDPTQWLTAYTEFDQVKAKGLLDGLGLKKDSSGNYLRSDGKPLTINLETITEEGWGNTVELVAKQWTDLGIKCQYSPIDRDLWSQRNDAGQLDFFIWHDYSYSERGAAGGWSGWALSEKAWDWYYWLTTNGAKGKEPPQNYKDYYANVLAMNAATYGSDAYKTLAGKVWDFRVTDQLYSIGSVGDYPSPLLVKTDLGNIGNNAIPFNYWQGQYPEQWYWKDAAHRADQVP
jgi:peptide/nickel transport system substrate-binding protein